MTPVSTEVVIVGGGIMGASTAHHLARAGVTDVVVLEAGTVAGGSSGKPLGGVRVQFSDRANIELGLRSLHAYGRFADEPGVDIGLRRVGYLFAVRDPADVGPFEASIALQNELGAVSRMVSPAEAAALCPHLDPSALVAAAWSPGDGFARPAAAVHGYLGAAAARGVTVRTGARVVAIGAVGDRALVRTADGTRYAAPAVVCAAGAWSGAIGDMVGVALPVEPLRRQIGFTPPLPPGPSPVPFTIDFSTTAYFHGAKDGGLVVGMSDSGETAGFDVAVTDAWHPGLRAALASFAPGLADVPIVRGWAGLYEMTPDCNGLIGATEGPGFRFLYAAGFSGHGFLQGPAVGECVRDLHLGRPPVVDVACFDARRFERAAVRTELGII